MMAGLSEMNENAHQIFVPEEEAQGLHLGICSAHKSQLYGNYIC